MNPELSEFGINTGKTFTSGQLIRFIRKFAHCFARIEDAQSFIKKLQNFEVKFEQTVVKQDDRKGNTEDAVKNAIKYSKGELDLILDIAMPFFKGCDPVLITLDIEIDRDGTTPVFGFYSLDFEVKLREFIVNVMTQELTPLKSNFVCIEQI